jgi:hypothetical protein
MSGQENKRPNELVVHAPVTLRRFRAEDNDALYRAVTESPGGTGTGVVWRRTRPPADPVT